MGEKKINAWKSNVSRTVKEDIKVVTRQNDVVRDAKNMKIQLLEFTSESLQLQKIPLKQNKMFLPDAKVIWPCSFYFFFSLWRV